MQYNLIDEKWIPCRSSNGKVDELSIRDVLVRSKDIVELMDGSPLAVASLHRLLLAILERSMEIRRLSDIQHIWQDGKWNNEAIERYLDKWHGRFDLFDDKRPFYQYPDLSSGDPITIHKLFNEYAAANNMILFDHRFDVSRTGVEISKVARGLVAAQSYSLGGGAARP